MLVVFVGCLIVTFVRLGGLAVVYSCCGCVGYGLDCVICWLVLIVLLWWPVIIVGLLFIFCLLLVVLLLRLGDLLFCLVLWVACCFAGWYALVAGW